MLIIDAGLRQCVALEPTRHVASEIKRAPKIFSATDYEASLGRRRMEIERESMKSAKNFLTFAFKNSLAVTLVSRLAKFDRHFFLDFIFL
jgi:hypothetical protein